MFRKWPFVRVRTWLDHVAALQITLKLLAPVLQGQCIPLHDQFLATVSNLPHINKKNLCCVLLVAIFLCLTLLWVLGGRKNDFPLAVVASIPQGRALPEYLSGVPHRWLGEAIGLALCAVVAGFIFHLLRQRDRNTTRLERLAHFNAMLAQVNEIVASEPDEQRLLQATCECAIRYACCPTSMAPDRQVFGTLLTWRARGLNGRNGRALPG